MASTASGETVFHYSLVVHSQFVSVRDRDVKLTCSVRCCANHLILYSLQAGKKWRGKNTAMEEIRSRSVTYNFNKRSIHFCIKHTELRKSLCTWFYEVGSCCCLPLLWLWVRVTSAAIFPFNYFLITFDTAHSYSNASYEWILLRLFVTNALTLIKRCANVMRNAEVFNFTLTKNDNDNYSTTHGHIS